MVDPRHAFVERVKAIDPIFKRGDLKRFWPALQELVMMAPDRADVSKKKSHYLASLAVRSLDRDDAAAAIDFLDLADRAINPDHLVPFLVEERVEFRKRAQALLGTSSRRE